jgi:hypothetical protein
VGDHSRAGWNEALLKGAREYMAKQKTAAAMIVQSGKVVDQWGDVAQKTSRRTASTRAARSRSIGIVDAMIRMVIAAAPQ